MASNRVSGRALREAALVAPLPEPVPVSALSGDDQPRVCPNSVDEALAAWDAGQEVQTVEMGGMGDGYEMAIQCVGFELMRTLRDDPILAAINSKVADNGEFPPEFSRMLDERIVALDAEQEDGSRALGGLSGAQAGAAKAMAVNFTRHGWQNARDKVPERMIFVRRQDPRTLYSSDARA